MRACAARRTRAICTAAAASSATSRWSGLQDVAFLRSPVAHARILSRTKPHEHADAIFFCDDLVGRFADRHALGAARLQSVGISAAGHGSRAVRWRADRDVRRCEPGAGGGPGRTVRVEYDELPAIASCAAGRAPGAALLHEHWGDNLFLETAIDSGGIADVAAHGAGEGRTGTVLRPAGDAPDGGQAACSPGGIIARTSLSCIAPRRCRI